MMVTMWAEIKTNSKKIKRERRKLFKVTSQVEQLKVKRKVAQLSVSRGDDGNSVTASYTPGTSVSTVTTSTYQSELAFGVKNANKHKKRSCWRTFRAFSNITCNFMILVHRLYLCFAFVHVYKSPNIPNRLKSIRSSNQQNIYKTKSVPEHFKETVYGKTELDQHADTTVAGGNFIILKYTDIYCTVSPYDDQ